MGANLDATWVCAKQILPELSYLSDQLCIGHCSGWGQHAFGKKSHSFLLAGQSIGKYASPGPKYHSSVAYSFG